MYKEVPNSLKEYIDYMFGTECEKLKKAFKPAYTPKTYTQPENIILREYPISYKTYILEKIAEIEAEIE